METKKLTAKDLMIGDYMKYKDGTIVQIARVGDVSPMDAPIYCHTQLEGYFPCQFEDIEPIPLTAEMLEKNGFELYNQDFTSCRVYKFGCFDYIECHNDYEDGRYNYFSIGCYIEYKHFNTLQRYIHDVMKIRYAHELQHALRLCGINDKEIVL